MAWQESERVELKRCVTKDLFKTVVAFANGTGGDVFIGIDDDSQVVGIDDSDAEMLKISSYIHDLICPDLLPFVHIEPADCDGARIIRLTVEPGDEKPYYLAAKGLVPGGVYTRLGPATVPMSRRDIRRMIRDADGDSFDARHARRQDLTFSYAELFFKQRGIVFDEEHYRSLGMIARDGFFSNVALLISDQNPYTIKCATFNDDAGTEFINRMECEGSLLKQFEEALDYLRPANNLRSYFPSHTRIDKRDYPEQAVREGLLNALIHRDYDETPAVPTLIKMYRTQLVFVSRGALPNITLEGALGHESSPRNPRLLALFNRLGEVEAYGSGLPMIWELYRHEALEPLLSSNAFATTLSLPNVNTTRNPYLSHLRNDGPSLRGDAHAFEQLAEMDALPVDVRAAYERERGRDANAAAGAAGKKAAYAAARSYTVDATHVLLEYASNQGAFSREEAQNVLGLGRDGTLKVINGLVREGRLEKTGKARATRYAIVERPEAS